jgi:2-aminoadipate transaminase
LCAAPSYFVFLGLLSNLNVRSVGVAADEQGMIPEALEETLQSLDARGELPRVKAIYCTSYFDNPCSVSVSKDRRPKLVESAKRWSREGKIYVIEDAAYRELRYEGDDLPSLRAYDEQGDTVITTGTFSKSFSPGLRVGWGALPRELVPPVCDQKGNIDFGSPNLSQQLISKMIELDLYEPHLERLRNGYREKLRAMLEAADEHMARLPGVRWIRPQGGLYVWLTLPEEIDTGPDGSLFSRAMESGVLYVPGQYCYASEGTTHGKHTIRLSFGVQPADKIRQGMQALAEAISNCSSG